MNKKLFLFFSVVLAVSAASFFVLQGKSTSGVDQWPQEEVKSDDGQNYDHEAGFGPSLELLKEGAEHNESIAFYDEALRFQVPLEQTAEQRNELKERVQQRQSFFLRDIYELYFDKVGANGLITAVMEAYPNCHDRGHDIGKVIYAASGQIGESLRICSDACYSGCMHGVLMEAFSTPTPEPHEHTEEELLLGHVHTSLEDVEKQMDTICTDSDVLDHYKRGDCLHGVGHALMYLTNYDIPEAMKYCDLFSTGPERYYCATGAYMEYATNKWADDRREGRDEFYPCDTHAYPAACFRYLMSYVFELHYRSEGKTIEIVNKCLELKDSARLGCFHGIGNAHMGLIATNAVGFEKLCSFGNEDDQYVCIEGAIERMARYHPKEAERACKQLSGWKYDLCEQGRANQLYSLEKDFSRYLP